MRHLDSQYQENSLKGWRKLKIGLCSVTFRDKTVKEVIELAVKAELDSIEWGGDVHVPPGNEETARKVGELTRSHGIQVASYGSYYRVGEDTNFREILQTAKALGAPAVRVWPGAKGSTHADSLYRSKVIQETWLIADLAQEEGITVHFEFHENTLTDTNESAQNLLSEVNHPNIYTYWQPPNGVSMVERQASIDAVNQWISNIHLFFWESYNKRYSLIEGEREWLSYLQKIKNLDQFKQRHVLMEFVKDDDEDQFLKDARVLHNWRRML
ncbi:Xylose isomerase-like TIM barrel [Gracilibacillus ureilyticus]|uniref:Xylose isomerase-like TIM barrel n=1 Tax=Gracilibacillus ureilyticus TaxID=531814 RepID=A0A1H9QY03_9BACI|nr:Xylose isomerase-like TIM barrel [Gracilibacillus ureilyticus]